MRLTAKKCKGTGKAKSYGCGTITRFRKYGLCNHCLATWMNDTKDGKEYLSKLQLRAKRKTEKEERAKRNIEKKNAKTLAQLKSKLQEEVNTIVRLIDAGKNCISCGNATRQMHAGHYHSVGSSPSIRFHLDNIHKQCVICNNYKSGALRDYYNGLVARYGKEYANYVENLNTEIKVLKPSRSDIALALKEARLIIREIKRGKDFTRDEVNEQLNIYK